jgi:hypothetical protein
MDLLPTASQALKPLITGLTGESLLVRFTLVLRAWVACGLR